MLTRATGAAAALIVTAALALSAAQAPQDKSKPPAKPAAGALTTMSGVYTAQQAMRGEQTYSSTCISCHPPGWYALPAFKDKWNGLPLSKLFDLVTETMPKNEPGSLSDKEYIDAIAFILRSNKAPAGKTELAADPAALRRIRIDIK
jgi:mono/diheme cytochrome c family protein